MSLHEAALYYAELGYPVFPCVSGDKKPATANGFYAATTDPEQINRWWTANPNYNIAIPTHGLIVLDADAGNTWLTPDRAAVLMDTECPQSATPRGGRHYWFRQNGESFRCSEGKIAPKIDTRANGGYVVVAPSITPVGAYSFPVPLQPIDQLPELPRWLRDELHAADHRVEINPRAGSVDGIIVEGSRDAALFRIACCDREIGKTEDEILASLLVINRNRVNPPLPESVVRQKAKSAARYEPSQIRTAFACGWDCSIDFDEFMRPDKGDEPIESEIVDPGPFPQHLLHVPGFVADVVSFNLAGAHRPQPVLALSGAVALLATLLGHRLKDRTGVRSNLYLIAVATTGGGKERARVVNRDLLRLAGQDNSLIGPEDFTSGAAIVRHVAIRPVTLMQVDEMGRMLRATANAERNPALFAIVTDLMKLYSSAGSTYVSKAYADPKNNVRIEYPHVVLYGTTTPDAFFASLSHDSVQDGFLSRTLIFEGHEDPEWVSPVEIDPPAPLVEFVREWRDRFIGSGNVLPTTVVPETESASAAFTEFDRECKWIIRSGSELDRGVWVRAGEKARKLALVYAASGATSPAETAIGDEAAAWAIEVSRYLSQRLLWLCGDRLASNEYEAERNAVKRFIRGSGSEGVTRDQLIRKFRRLRSKMLSEVLESLEQGREVITQRRETKRRGRPSTVFLSTEGIGSAGGNSEA